ncbi:efflux transporter outer membrane subunit [Curvibacter sp. HBC61]|uniref:Efflux transporter outer membrane subunit n=1 Tax=Curvibacter cyanobacteriorum TaxID=3026422 RepID=A0ABT5N6F1_9BURK|nr:efflux transporter outer membrane subunit [Curvibacter sp. HBC61]MDD0840697.1 efflux transporter outer membrane subunit [Curvibacter sp. HBC61]
MSKTRQALSRSTLRSAPTALALALLLGGCSMIPTYERPASPTAASYPRVAGKDAADPAGPSAAELPWNRFYSDAHLRQLIELALANNRDLRVSVLNIQQAQAAFQIKRADLFPTVNLAGNLSSNLNGAGNVSKLYSAGLSVSAWELDFFGRVASLKEQALAQYLATDEARKAAQISLVASVANGWLTLQADQELLNLTRQTLASREDSVRLTRLRFDSGAASELDLRQAESLAESARATQVQLQRQRAQDENALVLLLGQALPAEISNSLAQSSLGQTRLPDVPAGLPSDLLTARPDIRQAEQSLLAANANIGAARAAFFPRITLTAGYGSASGQLSGLFKDGSWGFTPTPQIVLPLFDAGRNQAGLDTAKAGRDIAVAQYEKAIQSAFREVADALAGRDTLGDQLKALEAQALADTRRLKLSELRYQSGVASYLDLLDAQRTLFATQQSLVQTRLAQLQSQVTLYKVLGGGWTAPTTTAAATPNR